MQPKMEVLGTKGNVLDAIRDNELKADIIYACGPTPMLRAVKEYAKRSRNRVLDFHGRTDGMRNRSLSCLRMQVQGHKDEPYQCA